ncbi:MAG: SDR family oxidoreductase [Deltaproteobacteria bacterium]|jgi:NAD(P)-dependent dehydrogenase (short-subunit alcohol dehydrogenase family)|nr:SDR family oxidoreductase [Deltaproteobacteria bacterium]
MKDNNQIVAIVGGAGGLGLATVIEFSKAGYEIIILDITQEKCLQAEAFLKSLGLPPPRLKVPVDIASAQSVKEAFEKIDSAHLTVNHLINCAGVREVKMIFDLPPEEFMRVININLGGAYYCCQEASLRMKDSGGGSIVLVASVAGVSGLPFRPAYCASKHGIVGLTKNLALDLGKHKIRVNVIAPGTIRTPMTDAYYSSQDFLDGLDELVPLGSKAGRSEDVAKAALFLCSEGASFITGACLVVDGGWSAGKSYAIGAKTPYTAAGSST